MKLPPPITSRTNARVKALRAALIGTARAAGEIAGIEGGNLIEEALRSGIEIQTLFVRSGSEAELNALGATSSSAYEVVVLAPDVFESATATQSPQGIAATFAIPQARALDSRLTLALVLESVQDPGNVGTLLRSAEAFGADAVVLVPDSANAWGPKALRAAAGSVFRMPIVRASLHEATEELRGRGCCLLGAVAHGAGVREVQSSDLLQPSAILIGNEGAGLSSRALALCDERITIPCAVESLNAAVAGSTILYEAMRQRMAAREGTR